MKEVPFDHVWVFDNYHRLAGAPVVESLLMDRAIEMFLGAEVRDLDFKAIVKHLEKLQEDIILSHPRCRRCEISLTKNPIVQDHASLDIGDGRLNLMKVKKSIIFQEA